MDSKSAKQIIEEKEIIYSEAADWLSNWFEKNFDTFNRALLVDPPTLYEAFLAGWKALETFDKDPE